MEEGMKEIKCIVWDLDNTIWEGTLAEADDVKLKPGIIKVIEELDRRGILHSISSKNNYDLAMKKLNEFDIGKYFLYPEVHWNAKSLAIQKIIENLNINVDTILFIDDQEFEREEVKSVHPTISCLDSKYYQTLLTHPRLNPKFITEDSYKRRIRYLEDMKRKKEEATYEGPKEEFLAALKMKFTISEAKEQDLRRLEELTYRTNQLNSTGNIYSYEDLKEYMESDSHQLIVCELSDKYGSYGKIGLALLKKTSEYWEIMQLLMSCRVMSRGVGTVLLTYIIQQAKKSNVLLRAKFRPTDRNRIMYITYGFSNFKETKVNSDGTVVLSNDLSVINSYPSYIDVQEVINKESKHLFI
ncbi:HAD-IIIC family phosphatase [Virgibacillus proomii]|uniref:HAD-IIIC family phosphatase n=1 Tax=Virgibacillus proomii TaxID=84407 RepID=UPI001C112B9B|nr:HAD-IIIC family phosphatase [Virgibacillus proomii]MBU5265925.1 HAD-IIIC family phosphatase [Virgibacillus proomii]